MASTPVAGDGGSPGGFDPMIETLGPRCASRRRPSAAGDAVQGRGAAVRRRTKIFEVFAGAWYNAPVSAILEQAGKPVDLQSPAAAEAALRSFWRLASAW